MTGGRVLVTGAGGFVAGAIAAGLAAAGRPVTALDRSFDEAARRRLAGVDLVEANLALDDVILRDLPAASVLIHGAALTTGPEAMGITPAEHVTANMVPLLAMLRHAGRTRPRAFVFLSSSGVFAEGDGSPDLADTDAATAQGPYSAAKRAGEALVPGALGGVCDLHVVRLGYLYGPGEEPRPSRMRVSMLRSWIEAARAGAPLAVPANDPRRDWTWAPDLAPALLRLIEAGGRAAPVHLCAPEPSADSVVAEAIAARVPGTRIEEAPARPTKAPMRPSRLPALEGFRWTPLSEGLDALCAEAA